MNRLANKVAIVTGSTSGIGIGIARLYAAEGAQVIVCGRRAEKGQAVVDSITAEGGKAAFHVMDITDPASIEKLVSDTAETYGKIDILVNNAANVALKDGRVDELTIEMWDAIFQSDMRGTFYVTKCVLPYMRKDARGGSIINIGSMASCNGDLGSTAYASAKAGVDMLTKSVALQYGKDNVRCNCIRPGLIVTPENEAKVPQALKDIFLSNIMVNRYGCPEDIGHACVYFGSDESAYVSGQIITVDGGMNSHAPTVAQFRSMGSRTW
ncbi:MAG: SDR family NAD(P)-dependent oxidoreductase [Firmicutes bacterium]|nr:SDR family NAD(P)-dependent oxidoreductase [Bacillota bacterium]